LPTKLIATGDRASYAKAVKEAAAVLESGGIVGIPTETVYGLAASAEHPRAIERLRDVKGRPEEKKFTICIPLKTDVARFAAFVPRAAEKLINHFWPGPLTLVLPGKAGGSVGIRMPGLTLTRDILLKADTSVVIPSANPSGHEPATDARKVLEYFDGKIDLVIDGGPSQLAVASTVVEVTTEGTVKVLRRGAISEEEIRRTVLRTILYVCTGNLCRSPMAAGIARKHLAERLGVDIPELEQAGYRVGSAGTAALDGTPASGDSVEVMKEIGVDIGDHRSKPLTVSVVRDADEIYVMSPHHLDAVKEIDWDSAPRAKLLSPYGSDIQDPIGLPRNVYRRVRDEIRDAILKRLEEL
jgi:tRNA threonylcarbamoyl adenosine modification protein (Sua5/YciO/YrdC/YwlC family)